MSFIAPAPGIAAFVAAQKQLRQNFGSPVTCLVPNAQVWPDGTQINPDTQLPYDAMIQPTNAEYTEVPITALIIEKQGSPLRPQAEAFWDQLGLMSGMDIILDVDADDYPNVEGAVKFEVNTLTYSVEEWKPFSLAGDLYRWLLYGMED